MDDISLAEFDGFESIVFGGIVIGPAASVGADHVGTVADGPKRKGVLLFLNNDLVAEPYRNPVTSEFPDLEAKGLFIEFVDLGLHDCEFITLGVDSLDPGIRYHLDFCMLVLTRKFVVYLPQTVVHYLVGQHTLHLAQPRFDLLHR